MNFLIALLVFQRINRKRLVTVPATEPPFSICTVAKLIAPADEVKNRYSERRALRSIPKAPFAFKDLMIH